MNFREYPLPTLIKKLILGQQQKLKCYQNQQEHYQIPISNELGFKIINKMISFLYFYSIKVILETYILLQQDIINNCYTLTGFFKIREFSLNFLCKNLYMEQLRIQKSYQVIDSCNRYFFCGVFMRFIYNIFPLIFVCMKTVRQLTDLQENNIVVKIEEDQQPLPILTISEQNAGQDEEGYQEEREKETNFQRPSIEGMQQSQNNFLNFIETLGPLLTKKLPDLIYKHIHRKPPHLKTVNYLQITQYLSQRIEKMIKNKRVKKNWTTEDLLILIWVVGKYIHSKNIKDPYYGLKPEDWEHIAGMIPACTGENCMFKWLALKKINAEWRKAEEDILIRLTENKQKNGEEVIWNDIAKELFYQNPYRYKVYRGGKHCRERWNCFLNPNIKKGLWEKTEDIRLIELILKEEGDRKWSKLVPKFGGRTENALKNRFHLLMEKQLRMHNEYIMDEKEVMTKFLQRTLTETSILLPTNLDTLRKDTVLEKQLEIQNPQKQIPVQKQPFIQEQQQQPKQIQIAKVNTNFLQEQIPENDFLQERFLLKDEDDIDKYLQI